MWDVWSLKRRRPFLSVQDVSRADSKKERVNQLKYAPPCPPAAPGDLQQQRRRLAGCVRSTERELSVGGKLPHFTALSRSERAACTSPSPACALLPPLAARGQLGGKGNRASRALRLTTKGVMWKPNWFEYNGGRSFQLDFYSRHDRHDQAWAFVLLTLSHMRGVLLTVFP